MTFPLIAALNPEVIKNMSRPEMEDVLYGLLSTAQVSHASDPELREMIGQMHDADTVDLVDT